MGPWRRLFWSIGFVKADVAGCARTAELAVPVANALQTELSHFSSKYVLFILLRSLIDIGIKNSNCWDRMVMRVSYALALILLKTWRIRREKLYWGLTYYGGEIWDCRTELHRAPLCPGCPEYAHTQSIQLA
jgi:hypothetical protein